MTPLFLAMAASFGAGTLVAAGWPTRAGARVGSLIAALAGSVAALLLATIVLLRGGTWTMRLSWLLAPLGGVTFTLDPLGALFLAIIAFTGIPAALFAQDYLRPLDREPRGRAVHALFNLLLASMCCVASAGNGVAFLFGWELMALTSYLLVVSDPEPEDTPAAGLWYAVDDARRIPGAARRVPRAGATRPARVRRHAAATPPCSRPARPPRSSCSDCVAFGSKAGLVPLHVWLPRAHPAAPSHVSSLMSAAMVKLGIYGLIRLSFDLMPPGPAWWGGALLVVGVVTALTGALYSVAETQLKRVLAYSTIENVGLIAVGLGFALLMRGYGYPVLAAMGLVACLLHAVNHAAFKGLLFLGAGSVDSWHARRVARSSWRPRQADAADGRPVLRRRAVARGAAAVQRLSVRMADVSDARGRRQPYRAPARDPAAPRARGRRARGRPGGGVGRAAVRHHVPRVAADRRGGSAPERRVR